MTPYTPEGGNLQSLGCLPGANNAPASEALSVQPGTAHFQVVLDLDSDPITGSLAAPDRAPRRFTGWIELVAEIEALRRSGEAEGPALAAEREGDSP